MLDVVEHGGGDAPRVVELRLARPPANALVPELIGALRRARAEAEASGARGIVLSGTPGRFSGGLDVPALLALDERGIRELWSTFFSLLRELATSEVPIAAALTGHSPAGGTVLALFCDYRVMAEGEFVVGLNEVQVGLPVPPFLYEALAYVVGRRQAERLAVPGLLVPAAEALRCGLVDELVPVDAVVPRALGWVTELAARPPQAMRATRRTARRPLREAVASIDDALVEDVVRLWFSDESQAVLRGLAARLAKRARP